MGLDQDFYILPNTEDSDLYFRKYYDLQDVEFAKGLLARAEVVYEANW